jgi:hypothetical protein
LLVGEADLLALEDYLAVELFGVGLKRWVFVREEIINNQELSFQIHNAIQSLTETLNVGFFKSEFKNCS